MSRTDAGAGGDAPEAYGRLLDRYRRVANLRESSMLLNWDQQVTMPPGGTPARSRQLSALSETAHELLVDDAVAGWLADLADADLTAEEAANVREIRRQHERAAAVPGDLVAELSRVRSENQEVWRAAKADSDFERFAPRLERVRDLGIERARAIDPDRPPYEVQYEDSHPYVPFETIERIFDRLREAIPPLVAAIRESDVDPAWPFEGEYPEADQRALSEAALDFLGYDRERGRLDTAPHPFMSGNAFDARVTTRFDPEDPMDGLTATVHEFGHATYQLGLPEERYGTPLGESRTSIHESQSRFWENHVGRTEPFWEAFAPTVREHLGVDATARELYEAANRVRPDNPIRVQADELTYHLHVLVRSEIGREVVAGELPVGSIPAAWNDRMDEYLGVRPASDAEGPLQDIHWTGGFAAFEGYTLGSVVAAQLDAAVREDLDVDGLVREGEFEPIHEWLTENVHRHGQRYTTPELIEVATGDPLTADHFLEYVREKFSALYDL